MNRLVKLLITLVALLTVFTCINYQSESERAEAEYRQRMERDIREWNRTVREGRERLALQREQIERIKREATR